MKMIEGAVRLDFFEEDSAVYLSAGQMKKSRGFLLSDKQRAQPPYPYAGLSISTIAADAKMDVLPGSDLAIGPFLPRKEWEGAADERRYTHLLVALTNELDGREEDFDEWYWNQHMPDGLRLPGCYAGRRYLLSPDGVGQYRHLAIYQFDVKDIGDTIDALAARAGTAEMPFTDALSPVFAAWFVKPVGDWS